MACIYIYEYIFRGTLTIHNFATEAHREAIIDFQTNIKKEHI